MINNNQLKAIVERIERLEEEKRPSRTTSRTSTPRPRATASTSRLRTIIRMRKQDANTRAEQETILETYMQALGMLADTPLGQAALQRATA
jgi:uncharacterized protein (UPF0335 family)